jgi:hypothetical protein
MTYGSTISYKNLWHAYHHVGAHRGILVQRSALILILHQNNMREELEETAAEDNRVLFF